ncbi:MAG: type IV pilus inner membrane component PilO [Planctomycetota bacterium]|jgi:Tfp pilus assembly protein PilO
MVLGDRQQIMVFVMAGAMTGGFLLFRYLPLSEEKMIVEQTKAAQETAIAKARAESEQLPVLTRRLQELKSAVADYESKVPGNRDLGAFLQQIASMMHEHDLKDQLVQPGKEVRAEGLKCIPINMQCKGGLKQIFEFFGSLQSLDRLVRVEHVKLKNDSNFGGQVSMETKTFIYYRTGVGQG